jgi:hypothetical protein
MKAEKDMENYYFAKGLSNNLMSEGYTFGASTRLESLKDFDFVTHILVATPPPVTAAILVNYRKTKVSRIELSPSPRLRG